MRHTRLRPYPGHLKGQIKAGAILIQEGTAVPNCLWLETDPYSLGWGLLENLDRREFDDELCRAGWIALVHASEIRTNVFGLDRRKAIRTAMKRLLSSAETREFNSLEIRHVVTKRFLGVHAVMVLARLRHIQINPFLSAS